MSLGYRLFGVAPVLDEYYKYLKKAARGPKGS